MSNQKDIFDTNAMKTVPNSVIRATDIAFSPIQTDQAVQIPFAIEGVGNYLPSQIIHNHEYEQQYGIDADWIARRTGIFQRRQAPPDMRCSDMAIKAIERMRERYPFNNDQLDMIIFSSMSGDFSAPPTACIIQGKLGARHAKAFDIIGSCTSFLQSLHIAGLYLAMKQVKTVLLVSADLALRGKNDHDKNTAILLGDGAGCMLLTQQDAGDRGIIAHDFGTDGREWDVATILGGASTYPVPDDIVGDKYWFAMDGKRLFRIASRYISASIQRTLDRAGLSLSDIDLFIPHQANYRIIEHVLKRHQINSDKMKLTIGQYGNTATSSIPITFAEYVTVSANQPNQLIMSIGFGAGFNWSTVIIKC